MARPLAADAYDGVDADIRTWKEWTCDDGSQTGSLWTWYGSARNRHPFALHGIALGSSDENGLVDWTYVYYPYEHDEVERILQEGS